MFHRSGVRQYTDLTWTDLATWRLTFHGEANRRRWRRAVS